MSALTHRYQFIRDLEHTVPKDGRSTLAKDTITGNLVVIKEFHCEDDQQREARLGQYQAVLQRLQAINSTRIVKYLHTQKNSNGFYLIRDYIPHRSLEQRFNLPYRDIQRIAGKILDTLIHIHQRDQNCTHANLKPSNIFIDPQGTTQLTDFGLLAGDSPPSPVQDLKALALTVASLIQQQPFTQLQTASTAGIPLNFEANPLIPRTFQDWLQHLLGLDDHTLRYSLDQAQSDLQSLAIATPNIPTPTPTKSSNWLSQWRSLFRRSTPRTVSGDWLLKPVGEPTWTEAEFQALLIELGEAGYGWLDPDEVRFQLEQMKKQRYLS